MKVSRKKEGRRKGVQRGEVWVELVDEEGREVMNFEMEGAGVCG
jgi:hypothetical protein